MRDTIHKRILMEVCEFHGKIYGKYSGNLYVLEPTWDSFRPIQGVAWNGEKYVIQELYKQDIFDTYYGYGSQETKQLCLHLTERTNLESARLITDSEIFWRWCGSQDMVWWKDRYCVFTKDCTSNENWAKYLHFLNESARTLRRVSRRKLTKRNPHIHNK